MRLLRDSRRVVISGLDGDRQMVCSPTRPIAPLASSSVAADNITQGGLRLTWSAPSSPRPVATYRVYRDGLKVYDDTARTFTDSGLAAATQFSYVIRAVDIAGVEGVATTALVVTTLAAPPPPPPPDPDPDPLDTVPPSAVTGLAAAANGATGAQLSFNETTDASGIAQYRILRNDELADTVAGDAGVAGVVTWLDPLALLEGASYDYQVLAVDGAGNVSDAALVTYTVPVPPVWGAAVIGSPSIAGSVVEGASDVTLSCGGVDIWSTSDQFRFAYRQCTGDFVVDARVASLTNSNEWAKAGVMFRESLAASSKFALMLMTPTAVRGATFHYRTATGGSAGPSGTQDSSSTLPKYVRVQRVGNTFSGWKSADGVTWVQHGSSVVIDMPATVYFGLAVTSHAAGALATAVFDHIAYQGIPADTAAPTVPTGLQASVVASDRIDLTWSASTDAVSGVAGYVVRRGTTVLPPPVGTLHTGTAFSVTGLSAATAYSFSVAAVDNVGNQSAFCTPVNATTPAIAAQGPYIDPPIPPFNTVRGTARTDQVNLNDHYHSPSGKAFAFTRTDGNSLPAGHSVSLSGAGNSILTRTYDGSGSGDSSVNVTIRGTEQTPATPPSNDDETSWALRSAGRTYRQNFSSFADSAALRAASRGAYAGNVYVPGVKEIHLHTAAETGAPAPLSGGKCIESRTFDTCGGAGAGWGFQPLGTTVLTNYYVQFHLWLNEAAWAWKPLGSDGQCKLFIIGEYGAGEVVLVNQKQLGFPGVMMNGSSVIKRRATIAGTSRDFYQPAIYTGEAYSNMIEAMRVMGPGPYIAQNLRDYGYKPAGNAVSNYLNQRGFSYPDADAILSGAPVFLNEGWNCFEFKVVFGSLVRAYCAPRWSPPVLFSHNEALDGPGTLVDGVMGTSGQPGGHNLFIFTNYDTPRSPEPGYRPLIRQFGAEFIVDDNSDGQGWIGFPGYESDPEPA